MFKLPRKKYANLYVCPRRSYTYLLRLAPLLLFCKGLLLQLCPFAIMHTNAAVPVLSVSIRERRHPFSQGLEARQRDSAFGTCSAAVKRYILLSSSHFWLDGFSDV